MLIPSLEGWVAGEKVTAAKLTKHTKTAIESAVYYKPFCELQNAASQSVGVNFVQLALPNIVEDTDGMANVAASQIKIKTAGRYRIAGQCTWGAANAGRGVFIVVNGAYRASTTNPNASSVDTHRLQVSRTIRLAVNDVIGLYSWTNVAATTDAGYGGVWLSAEWVSL